MLESTSNLRTYDVELADLTLQKGLIVGVAKDKVNTLNAFFHHVVDGIAAATTHSDDLDIVWLFYSNGLEHLVLRVGV